MTVHALTREQAAALAGLSLRGMSALVRDGEGPMKDADARYPVEPFRAWLIDRIAGDDEEGRLTRVRADKIELEIAEKRGELVKESDVERQWAERIAACRARLILLAPTVAPLIAPIGKVAELQAAIQRHVYAALDELANEDIADGRGGDLPQSPGHLESAA